MFQSRREWDGASHLEFNTPWIEVYTQVRSARLRAATVFTNFLRAHYFDTFMSCDPRLQSPRLGRTLLIRWAVEQIRYTTPILFCGRMSSAVYIIAIRVTHTASVAWAGRLSPLVPSRVLCEVLWVLRWATSRSSQVRLLQFNTPFPFTFMPCLCYKRIFCKSADPANARPRSITMLSRTCRYRVACNILLLIWYFLLWYGIDICIQCFNNNSVL